MNTKLIKKMVIGMVLLFIFYCTSNVIDIEKFKQIILKKQITVKVLTYGLESTRLENLISAAEKLNYQLSDEGKNIQVNIEANSFNYLSGGGWEGYRKLFISQFSKSEGPDIYITGHENIGWLAKGNYIINLDELKNSKAYSDVFGTLWNSIIWKGHVWGALQDAEVANVFVNVKKLEQLGWSKNQIESLKYRVRQGQFTIEDMSLVAKEAVDKGIVKWGILHRPINGQIFYSIAKNFKTQIFDEQEDKIIVDKNKLIKSLEYFNDLTQKYKVTPPNMTSMNWKQIYKEVINGETLFWYGGTYSMFDFIKEGGAEYNKLMEEFDFMLIPASKKNGKPFTISHPLIYTVSSQCKNKDLAIRLLEIVADKEYQSKHAVETYHLPINKSGAQTSEFKDNKYLNSVMYMLDYTTFLPNDDKYVKYSSIYFKAIQNVEKGKFSPKLAADYMEKELKEQFKEKCVFK